jgi:hypothetical protein
MRKRKYTGLAFNDRGVLKFKIMQDGIWYGTLTIRGHIYWQECQRLTNPVAAEAVSLRRKTF